LNGIEYVKGWDRLELGEDGDGDGGKKKRQKYKP
jgi:hypothetical protein